MHQHESVGEPGRPHPSQGPREARACNLLAKFQSFQPVALLLLAAAFLLAACAPVESSSAPRKKTEAEALQALETETGNLGEVISKEIDARVKYVKAADSAGVPIVWRLLRRIVLLGATPAQEAEVKRLLEAWEAAKKAVEEVEQKIESLIAELKNMESETAKQVASTAETDVQAVVAVVQEVRKENDPATIDQVATKAKTDLETTVKKAKETVKKAVETAQKNEEHSNLPAKTLIYVTADRKIYKLSGGNVNALSLFFEESVLGLPIGYTVLIQGGDKVYVRGAGGARTAVKNIPEGAYDSRSFVYRNGYVYYKVEFSDVGNEKYEIWRFRPEQPQNAKRLVEKGEHGRSFAVDENGNVLYQDSIDISGRPTEVLKLRLADGTTITPSLDGTNPISLSGSSYSYLISGTDGQIYLIRETGSTSRTLQLYQFAKQAQTLQSASDPDKNHVVTNEQAQDKKFVRITQKNSISVSGGQPGSGASATHIDKAVFDLRGSYAAGSGTIGYWEVVRLANGRLSKVGGLPKEATKQGAKLHYLIMNPGVSANATGSDYIYTNVGNKVYRVGAAGGFTEFFDAGDDLKLLDRGFTPRTNNRGEFAVAAEDNNGNHWIIELKPNGKEKRRTKAVGKLNEYGALYYVDF